MEDPNIRAGERWLRRTFPLLTPGTQTDTALAIAAFVEDDDEALRRLMREAGLGLSRDLLRKFRLVLTENPEA